MNRLTSHKRSFSWGLVLLLVMLVLGSGLLVAIRPTSAHYPAPDRGGAAAPAGTAQSQGHIAPPNDAPPRPTRPDDPSRTAQIVTDVPPLAGIPAGVPRLAPVAPPPPKAPLVIITSIASGNWSNPATWSSGTVPTAADDVTIANATTVTIDIAAVANSVTVGQGASGVLQFDPTTGRPLTVTTNVTVAGGGIFQANPTGAVTTHALSLGGSLTNSGTIDFSQNGNASQAAITFTGAANATWTNNAGATLNLKGSTSGQGVTLNKGTSAASVLDFYPGGTVTVQGANTSGFLLITNGTFRISGTNTFSNPVFYNTAYIIPATGGIWLNNANATIVAQGASPTNGGLLRLTAGTYNVGTGTGNSLGATAGAQFIIEGGTMNVASRLTATVAVTYTQSAGTVNVNTVANAAATPSFGFTSILPTNVMNMSGGTINLVQAATSLDYNQQGTVNFSGGTLNVGTVATATNFVFRAQGNMPNVVIDTTTTAKTLNLSSTAYVYGNVTIPATATLNLNNFILNELGSTFTNNGALTGTFAAGFTTSRLQFAGAVAQTYTGTGTAGSAVDPLFGFALINRGAGVTIDPTATPIYVTRLLAFSGALINTAKINVVPYTTNLMIIQRGGIAQLPPGTLDVTPTFPGGSAALVLVYSQAATPITTGVE
ncbi:MAG: G8 domain-containing protein, partial [Chloroflexota bacterium]|nr:G8 domain-containing protein [Chloroflexota bacterium]